MKKKGHNSHLFVSLFPDSPKGQVREQELSALKKKLQEQDVQVNQSEQKSQLEPHDSQCSVLAFPKNLTGQSVVQVLSTLKKNRMSRKNEVGMTLYIGAHFF